VHVPVTLPRRSLRAPPLRFTDGPCVQCSPAKADCISFLTSMDQSHNNSAERAFIRIPASEASQTHFFNEVQILPHSVVRCFGTGDCGDGYKVSHTWAFRRGELIYSLYDWKSTHLYDSTMWTPQELWASNEPFDLHVGSREPATQGDVADFITFLLETTSM